MTTIAHRPTGAAEQLEAVLDLRDPIGVLSIYVDAHSPRAGAITAAAATCCIGSCRKPIGGSTSDRASRHRRPRWTPKHFWRRVENCSTNC